MLLSQLKSKFHNGVLEFLWRQWSQLGVAGKVEFRDRWIIDPEALLLFTLDVGRYDPRLFDEVLDWSVRNGRWLSMQRLKNLADRQVSPDVLSIVGAFADLMAEHDTPARWRNLAALSGVSHDRNFVLFLDAAGRDMPLLGSADPVFAKHGVLRPPVRLRGMSRPVPMDVSTNLLFKLRALFGLGTRPEVIAYLLTHRERGGYPSEVARSTCYSAPSVQQTMADLADSGLIAERQSAKVRSPSPMLPVRAEDFGPILDRQSAKERRYSLDPLRCRQFLGLKDLGVRGFPSPGWVDWPRLFAGVSILTAFLTQESLDQLSDYMLGSRLWSLAEELEPYFADTGLSLKVGVHPVMGVRPGIQGSPNKFHALMMRLIGALNPRRGFKLEPAVGPGPTRPLT